MLKLCASVVHEESDFYTDMAMDTGNSDLANVLGVMVGAFPFSQSGQPSHGPPYLHPLTRSK